MADPHSRGSEALCDTAIKQFRSITFNDVAACFYSLTHVGFVWNPLLQVSALNSEKWHMAVQ